MKKKTIFAVLGIIAVVLVLVFLNGVIERSEWKLVENAKTLVFMGVDTPIGELIGSHPDIDQDSIEWQEIEPLANRRQLLCRFKFKNQEGEQQVVHITISVLKRIGSMTEVVVWSGSDRVDCLDIGVFLHALKNKAALDYAVLGYATAAEFKSAPYTDYTLVENPYGYEIKSLGITWVEFLTLLEERGVNYKIFTPPSLMDERIVVTMQAADGEGECTFTFLVGTDWLCLAVVVSFDGMMIPPNFNREFLESILQVLRGAETTS